MCIKYCKGVKSNQNEKQNAIKFKKNIRYDTGSMQIDTKLNIKIPYHRIHTNKQTNKFMLIGFFSLNFHPTKALSLLRHATACQQRVCHTIPIHNSNATRNKAQKNFTNCCLKRLRHNCNELEAKTIFDCKNSIGTIIHKHTTHKYTQIFKCVVIKFGFRFLIRFFFFI